MNVRTKATLLLVAWLVAYTVIGGVVWVVSMTLLPRTAMDDTMALMVAVALTIALGWLGASWTQRRVESALSSRAQLR